MINYARMTPVYVSQMMDLKENDEKACIMMMEGSFCVGKSKVPFTSLGADHVIELENQSIKVMGGIKGMNISLRQQRLAILLRHFATNLVFPNVKLAKEKITTNSQDQRIAGFKVTSLKLVTYSDNVYNVLTMKSATQERC